MCVFFVTLQYFYKINNYFGYHLERNKICMYSIYNIIFRADLWQFDLIYASKHKTRRMEIVDVNCYADNTNLDNHCRLTTPN